MKNEKKQERIRTGIPFPMRDEMTDSEFDAMMEKDWIRQKQMSLLT